jgi:hypothetical protein
LEPQITYDQAFNPRADGSYDIQPAGVLPLLGREISTRPPTALRTKLESHVRVFLQAARAGGYKQTGVLETLLTRGDTSKRVLNMCHEACAAAGNHRIKVVMDSMGPGGD